MGFFAKSGSIFLIVFSRLCIALGSLDICQTENCISSVFASFVSLDTARRLEGVDSEWTKIVVLCRFLVSGSCVLTGQTKSWPPCLDIGVEGDPGPELAKEEEGILCDSAHVA
jgi:hypothetical protein